MDRIFPLSEARALLPEMWRRAAELVVVRADLTELTAALAVGAPSRLGGVAEVKSLEARFHEGLGWFAEQSIHVKGIAPLLVDFPSVHDEAPVLLCWLEGETELAWYHRAELGFAGRRPIPATW